MCRSIFRVVLASAVSGVALGMRADQLISASPRGRLTLTSCWPVRVSVRTTLIMAGIMREPTPEAAAGQLGWTAAMPWQRESPVRYFGIRAGLQAPPHGRAVCFPQRLYMDPKMDPNLVFGGFPRLNPGR
jgi:hypothetical protein